MAHAAFFRDVAAYLSAVYNGVFPGKSVDLVDFARKMRAMRVTPCTEELVGEIITMENLSLAPDKTDRQLLPDWRCEPDGDMDMLRVCGHMDDVRSRRRIDDVGCAAFKP